MISDFLIKAYLKLQQAALPYQTWKPDLNAYILGGSFDPVQDGHVDAIRQVMAIAQNDPKGFVVVAPTSQNPWKQTEAESLEHRLQMLFLALSDAGIATSAKPFVQLALGMDLRVREVDPPRRVCLLDFKYYRTWQLVSWWRRRYRGKIFAVSGPDGMESVKKWKYWNEMGLETQRVEENIPTHSTDVREGRVPPMKCLHDYIEANGLYPNAKWDGMPSR